MNSKYNQLICIVLVISVALFSCVKDRDTNYNPYLPGGITNVSGKQLIHYWDFNQSVQTPSYTKNGASWQYKFSDGTPAVYDSVVDTTTLNARLASDAGQALRLRNPAGSFILNLPTTGFKNMVFSFAVKRSSNGAQINQISYSTDGATFTSDGLDVNLNKVNDTWTAYSYNLSGIAAANDNANFKIKIDFFVNNTGTSGNDRFDNITLDGDSIPAPPKQLLHYWNFNNSDTAETFAAASKGALTIDFISGGYFDFTTSNAQANTRNGDSAGLVLRVRNPVNALYFNIPSTGYKNVVFKYAVARTNSGAQNNTVYYTLDGTNYVSANLSYNPSVDPTYTLQTVDFTTIPQANNNPNLGIKIVFGNGNTGTSGNNRFDNVTLDGIKQ